MKDLTIVCVNKNSEKFILQSIKTFLSQDYSNFEILIMDSDSKDRSIDIIKSFNSDIIKVYNLEGNINEKDAFRIGISQINTEYITFMTSTDGYLDNEWFSKAIKILNNDIELSFVFANSARRNEQNKIDKINQEFFLDFQIPEKEYFLPFYLSTQYHVNELNCIWSTTIVKKFINQENNFNNELLYDLFESLENWIVRNGYLGKHINTLANYGRIHSESLTMISQKHSLKEFIKQKNISLQNKRKKILDNLHNMTFFNRNSVVISKVDPRRLFNFYINYYFYKFFYPPSKISKPIYSIHYILSKFKYFFLYFILRNFFKITIRTFNKNKFYR